MGASWHCKKCPYANALSICTKCGWVPSAEDLPDAVTLCAIGYHVRAVEGAVLFSSQPGIAGCFTRLTFTRHAGCWYVSTIDSDDKAMVAHISAAMKLVVMWFGGDHVSPRGESVP